MENGMRILGLDFGSKTVGVAVTDPLGYTAQGVEIIRRDSPNKLRKTLARIEQLVEQYNIEKIVLGYPVMLSGTEGERVKKTKEFGAMLERRTGLEIVCLLYTSVSGNTLNEFGEDKHETAEDKIKKFFKK